jgi:hypothetical protein
VAYAACAQAGGSRPRPCSLCSKMFKRSLTMASRERGPRGGRGDLRGLRGTSPSDSDGSSNACAQGLGFQAILS